MSSLVNKLLPSYMIRQELRSPIKQKEGESLDTFRDRIVELVTLGYPNTCTEFKQIISSDIFLKGISNQKVADIVKDPEPDNIDLALILAKAVTSNINVNSTNTLLLATKTVNQLTPTLEFLPQSGNHGAVTSLFRNYTQLSKYLQNQNLSNKR